MVDVRELPPVRKRSTFCPRFVHGFTKTGSGRTCAFYQDRLGTDRHRESSAENKRPFPQDEGKKLKRVEYRGAFFHAAFILTILFLEHVPASALLAPFRRSELLTSAFRI